MAEFLREIKIRLAEDRPKDAWFDFSLRQLREGNVRFYRVDDFLTGEWLFKVCTDRDVGKVLVKAIKCPAGKLYAQLEGDTMVFQKSVIEGFLYDIISLSYIDEEGRMRRKVVGALEEVPDVIQKGFEIRGYEEATGKKAPGKNLVTMVKEEDEKAMIILFLIERTWPLSPVPPEVGLRTVNIMKIVRELEKASVEEIYRVANQQYGVVWEEVDRLLKMLEKEGKITSPSPGYVKAV